MRISTEWIGDAFIWLRIRSVGHPCRWACYLALLRAYQECSRFARRIRDGFKRGEKGVCLKYFTGQKNFGDMLNVDLMNWLGIAYSHATDDSANLLCIGSLMDELLVTDWQLLRYSRAVHVFGAGFMHDRESSIEKFNRPVALHGLRGKLSLARCETICGHVLDNVVLGDPGLLVNEIFPRAQEQLYDVGVICHYNDFHSEALKNLQLPGLTVRMIDVHSSTADFARQVSACKLILSSALHGLICADAYGVPNRHIVLSWRVEGAGYKFRDYYSVFPSAQYEPIDLRTRTVTVDDARIWMMTPVVPAAEVAEVQWRLRKLMSRIKDCVR